MSYRSHTNTGILGVIAFATTFGAVQLASGHDLASGFRALSTTWTSGVNRAAKADRLTPVAATAAPTRTISIQLEQFANSSILIRVPLRHEASSAEPAKKPIACEGVVSVLTEIAKRLQPGRCVT